MNKISGPVNLVRIEGEVDNIKKVFYLFMDYHIPLGGQTECIDVKSINIKNYLFNTFENCTEKCDFFLELFPDVSTYQSELTKIYLNQLRTAFENALKFKFQENKIIVTDEYPNLRLHYMDIRSYFTFTVGDPFGVLGKLSEFIYSHTCMNLIPNDLMHIKNGLDILNSQLKVIYDTCFGELNNTKKMPFIRKFNGELTDYSGTEAVETIKYIMNKIRNVYKHENIKKKVNDIMNEEIIVLFNNYLKFSDEMYKFIDESIPKLNHKMTDRVEFKNKKTFYGLIRQDLSDDIMNKIIKIYKKIHNNANYIYILIMDLYFLRRSLDKDYIKNAIVYTGAFHSANYIRFLINKFNFKITHAYYSEIKEMDKLNKKIINMTDSDDVLGLFLPTTLYQCIDVSNFPKNFS